MDRLIPRLKLIRWKKGLSQRKLSSLSGVPVWKISQIEAGKRIPTILEVALIQKAVGVQDLMVLNPGEVARLKERLCWKPNRREKE